MTMATVSSLTDRTDRIFEIQVQAGSGQKMGRTSTSTIKVSYSTLAHTISAIGRRGAKIISVTMLAFPSTEVVPVIEVKLEPIAEIAPIVEEIVELEPIIEAEEIVELEPITEVAPVVELEPIAEVAPVVEAKPVQTTVKATETKQNTRRQQSSKSKKR
jgi:CpcD/allophycocyanin linker domain